MGFSTCMFRPLFRCDEVKCYLFPLCSISSPVSACQTRLSECKSKVNTAKLLLLPLPCYISHFTPCSDLVVRILGFYSCTCLNLNDQNKKTLGKKRVFACLLHIIVCKASYFLLLWESWLIEMAQMFEKGEHEKVTRHFRACSLQIFSSLKLDCMFEMSYMGRMFQASGKCSPTWKSSLFPNKSQNKLH